MHKAEMVRFLQQNGLNDVEVIDYKDDIFVVSFFYDFDKDELGAAKDYADDESGEEQYSDNWANEFFIPYLNDIAVDNIGDVIEETMEKFEVKGEFVSYGMDLEEGEYSGFVAVFSKSSFDIEKVLDDLEL